MSLRVEERPPIISGDSDCAMMNEAIRTMEDELCEARLLESDALEWAIAACDSRITQETADRCNREYERAKEKREIIEQALNLLLEVAANGVVTGGAQVGAL